MMLNFLCCPMCKGSVKESKQSLACAKCKQRYPVIGGIPVLLPPTMQNEYHEIKKIYEQENVARFFGCDEQYTGSVTYRNKLRKKVAKIISEKMPRNGIVLDAGCGNGLLLEKIHAKRQDLVLWGIDFSYPMVLEARKRCPFAFFCVGSVHALPIKSEAANGTVCIDVLHHFAQKEMIYCSLDELMRATHKKGIVIAHTFISTFLDPFVSLAQSLLRALNLKKQINKNMSAITVNKIPKSFMDAYLQQNGLLGTSFRVHPLLNWVVYVMRRTQ